MVEDFWQRPDREPGGYFIGSMVVYIESDDCYGLVDGQQRLTTITILLAAIRNELRALSEEDEAKGVQTLIERKDLSNQERFVLETETSYPYLQGQIQSLPGAVDAVVAGRRARRRRCSRRSRSSAPGSTGSSCRALVPTRWRA